MTRVALSYSNVDYSGTADCSAHLLAEMQSFGSSGGTILLRPGTVKISPGAITLSNRVGVSIIGSGDTATTFQLGTGAGDGIVFDHCYGCRVENVAFSSTSKRTSGSSLKVVGGHASYRVDAATMTNFTAERIDFTNQATSFEVSDTDSSSPGGAWDVTFKDSFCYNSSDDADCFLVNSPRGGIHVIENVFLGPTTVPDTTHRPANGLRIRASNDFTVDRFSQILCKNGMTIDPAAEKIVRAGNFIGCYFDSNNTYGVRVDSSVGTADQLQFSDLWSASNQHNIALTGAHDLVKFVGAQCFRALLGWGAIVDGGTRTKLLGVDFGGVGLGGVWVTGSSSDFQVSGCSVGPAYEIAGNQPIGIQIDAGCDHYTVTGNNFRQCTTPITNTPGTSAGRRIVQDNVIA